MDRQWIARTHCSAYGGARHAADHVAGPHPLPRVVQQGWQVFAELVPAEVTAWVMSVFDAPQPFAQELRSLGTTLVHADAWVPNVALEAEHVTLLDWQLATDAPGPVDLGIALAGLPGLAPASFDDLVAWYADAVGGMWSEAGIDRSLLVGLLLYGWNMALTIRTADLKERSRQKARLGWWVTLVQHAA